MNVKRRKNAVSPAAFIAGLAVLFLLILSVRKDLETSEIAFGDVIRQNLAQELGEVLVRNLVPVFSFAQRGEQDGNWMMEKQITGLFPIYGYSMKVHEKSAIEEQTDAGYISMEDIVIAENQKTEGDIDELGGLQQSIQPEGEQQSTPQQTTDSIQELLKQENEAALQKNADTTQDNAVPPTTFVRHELQNAVDIQVLSNYETLVQNFYTIDSNTMAGSDQLDVSKLIGRDLTISKESEGPQILIYHTHSQEAFLDSVPGDVNTTIVGVGEHLSKILTTEYGYQVLHHTGQYDVEARDDAYSKSLPDIERVLAENPTIQVIIDLHRDSMPEETKLVMDLDGRPTARFMFFNGLSRTQKTGNIAYLHNENLEDNLAFSFQMQLKATEYYPGLTRKIYLKGYRYNMHLRPRTTLIELGAQNNTVEEAMNACDPLAHILDMVLSGQP